jgi:predicted DNA-binding transcriptional regulator YafY
VLRMFARFPWEWRIEVVVDAPLEEVSRRVSRRIADLAREGDRTRLELGADSLEWAAALLAGLGADFRVVRPAELRAHVGELGARLVRAAR